MIRKFAFYAFAITLLGFLMGCASNTTAPAATTAAPGATAAPASTSAQSTAKPAVTPAKAAAGVSSTPVATSTAKLVLPSGTVITVRLNDTLASNVSQSGQSF